MRKVTLHSVRQLSQTMDREEYAQLFGVTEISCVDEAQN